jgi:hypothetical protein
MDGKCIYIHMQQIRTASRILAGKCVKGWEYLGEQGIDGKRVKGSI